MPQLIFWVLIVTASEMLKLKRILSINIGCEPTSVPPLICDYNIHKRDQTFWILHWAKKFGNHQNIFICLCLSFITTAKNKNRMFTVDVGCGQQFLWPSSQHWMDYPEAINDHHFDLTLQFIGVRQFLLNRRTGKWIMINTSLWCWGDIYAYWFQY